MITLSQLSNLHDRVGDDMYAATGGAIKNDGDGDPVTQNIETATEETAATSNRVQRPNRPLTRAEVMFTDLLAANWFTINPEGAYDIFALIDPDCPHCKDLINAIQPELVPGGIRLRVIPVGFTDEALRKAAVLLASANPGERLINFSAGDTSAIIAPANINVEGAIRNTAVMTKHRFDVTPILVYRTKGQEIRLVRGAPNNYETIKQDIDNN